MLHVCYNDHFVSCISLLKNSCFQIVTIKFEEQNPILFDILDLFPAQLILWGLNSAFRDTRLDITEVTENHKSIHTNNVYICISLCVK